METLEREDVLVRTLTPEDLPRLVRIDESLTGRNRRTWYESRLKHALEESDVKISLGVEMDGHLVGALLGSVQFGEFGQPEPIAILDTIVVDAAYRSRGAGAALLEQLERNLHGLRIERLRTEVGWREQELIRFLAKRGFAPAPRLVLEREIPDGGGRP